MPEPMYRQIQEWMDEPGGQGDQLDITSRTIAERKVRTLQLGEHCKINFEWYEFIDREAKSFYWSDVLRRTARDAGR